MNGLHFLHEPFKEKSGKNPDFLVTVRNKKILVEVKELSQTPLGRRMANATAGSHSFAINPKELWKILRDDIKVAAKQLVGFSNHFDFCLVLIGWPESLCDKPSLNDLFATMFGDQRIAFEVDALGNHSETRYVYTPSGALLNHGPERQHVSAVGFVMERCDFEYYQSRFAGHAIQLCRKSGMSFEESWNWYESVWPKHVPKLPARAKDPSSTSIFIHAVSNPFSINPLPSGLFASRWDLTLTPQKESET